jgi:outer membrane lipoprotein SlyB
MENTKFKLSRVKNPPISNNCYRIFLLVNVVFLFVGCASQRPVFYPNNQFNTAGKTVSKQDVDECMKNAAAYGIKTQPVKKVAGGSAVGAATGAAVGSATGAVRGHAGRGAAAGAAGGAAGGFMWGLFSAKKVDPVQKNFVEECLRLKGYKVIGWK